MNIVTAIDSMKGSMTSIEANQIVARVFTESGHTVKEIAIADGGEGTVAAALKNNNGQKITVSVEALNGKIVSADIGWFPAEKMAVIESAAASGIHYLDQTEKTHPLHTSSYGTGQMILTAAKMGAKAIVVGLGGTGTIDGGIGLLHALGVEFFDKDECLLPVKGESLEKIARISKEKLAVEMTNIHFYIASDVTSPLLGNKGAVQMFGRQKGLAEHQIERYENSLKHYQKIVTGKREPVAGDGAAGGIGFALRTFLNGTTHSGLTFIAEQAQLEKKISQADLVITGEGKMDNQSLQGKVPVGIARIAKKHDVPVLAFVGSFEGEPQLFQKEGLSVIVPIIDRITTLDEAIKSGKQNLENAVKRSLELLTLFQK
jgi:glycerate kinase